MNAAVQLSMFAPEFPSYWPKGWKFADWQLLKPCPTCGEQQHLEVVQGFVRVSHAGRVHHTRIECAVCRYAGPLAIDKYGDLIEWARAELKWNRLQRNITARLSRAPCLRWPA